MRASASANKNTVSVSSWDVDTLIHYHPQPQHQETVNSSAMATTNRGEDCPLCGKQFNNSNYRMLTEPCGHKNCLQCVLSSTNGCKQCLIKPREDDHVQTMEVVETNQIEKNDGGLENFRAPLPDLKSPSSKDSAIGSHISLSSSEMMLTDLDSGSSSKSISSDTSDKAITGELSVFDFLTRRKLNRLRLNDIIVPPIETPPSPPVNDSLQEIHETESDDDSQNFPQEVEVLSEPPRRRSLRFKKPSEKLQSSSLKIFTASKPTVKNKVAPRKQMKTFTCDKCDDDFEAKSYLRSHLVQVHSGVVRYECVVCKNHCTERKAELASHIQHAHNRRYRTAYKLADEVIVIEYPNEQQCSPKTNQRPLIQKSSNSTVIQEANTMLIHGVSLSHGGAGADEATRTPALTHVGNSKPAKSMPALIPLTQLPLAGPSRNFGSVMRPAHEDDYGSPPELLHLTVDDFGESAGNESGNNHGNPMPSLAIQEESKTMEVVGERDPLAEIELAGRNDTAYNTYRRKRGKNKPGRECSVCKSRFIRGRDLRRHLITHIDVHPYKCPKCHKVFKRKDNFVAHFKRFHDRRHPQIALNIARKAAEEYLIQAGVARADISTPSIHGLVM